MQTIQINSNTTNRLKSTKKSVGVLIGVYATEKLNPTEQWKTITGYEGRYEVSDKGRVRSLTGVFLLYLKPSANSCGYFQVQLRKDGNRKPLLVHRLVALAFIPNETHRDCVDHVSGDHTDNRLENLRWVTRQENHRFAAENGKLKGSVNTPEQVREIFELKNKGLNQKQIHEVTGISRQMITKIVSGKHWKHLHPDYAGCTI